MATVDVRAYLSPSLVLLAMDWPDGAIRNDFLGFAIRRTPGFKNLQTGVVAASDWLPNRLSFDGPPAEGQPDFPSKQRREFPGNREAETRAPVFSRGTSVGLLERFENHRLLLGGDPNSCITYRHRDDSLRMIETWVVQAPPGVD